MRMAAEAIETEAKTRLVGKVETRGSVGPTYHHPEEVAEADLVIVAADIEVDLARICRSPDVPRRPALALKRTAQELDKAVAEATPVSQPAGRHRKAATGEEESAGAYRHLLTGAFLMLPMVVAGDCVLRFPSPLV